jgi:hypothetical protein
VGTGCCPTKLALFFSGEKDSEVLFSGGVPGTIARHGAPAHISNSVRAAAENFAGPADYFKKYVKNRPQN